MRFCSVSVVRLSTLSLLLVASTSTVSAQTSGTWFCTALDASRQAGFVSQLFNVSQADAAKVAAACGLCATSRMTVGRPGST